MTKVFYPNQSTVSGVHGGTQRLSSMTDPGVGSPVEWLTSFSPGAHAAVLCFYSPSGEPNSADWPDASAGDPYHAEIDVTQAGSDLTYGITSGLLGHYGKVAGDLSNDKSIRNDGNSHTGTGLKVLFNYTGAWTAEGVGPQASDRYEVAIGVNNGHMHASEDLGINVDTSNTFFQGPWTAGPADQNVSPAALARTLTPVAPTRIDQQVSPAALGLTAAGIAPSVTPTVDPAALGLTAAGVAPSRMDQDLSPGLLARTLTPVAPRVDQEIAGLAAVGLAVAFPAPQLNQSTEPGVLAITLTPVAPRVDQEAVLSALGLAVAFPAPDVQFSTNPGSIDLTTTPVAPTRMDQDVSPAALAETVTPVAPSVEQAVDPAALALTTTPVAPTRMDQTVPVGSLAFALTAVAPRVDQQVDLTALALALAELAPTIDSGGTGQNVNPGVLALALANLAPGSIDQEVEAPVLSMTIDITEPDSISGPQNMVVDSPVGVTAAPVAPSSIDIAVLPASLALSLVAVAPQLDQFVDPNAIALALTPVAPLVEFQPQSVSPGAVAMNVGIIAPSRFDQTLELVNVLLVIGLPVPSVEGGTPAVPVITPDPWFRRLHPQGVPIEAWSLFTSLVGRYGVSEGRRIYERMLQERKGPFGAGRKYDPDRFGLADLPNPVPHIEIPKARKH